ncbi:MAG: hypothetical protein V1874_12515 [Spirochaetota bacterium]
MGKGIIYPEKGANGENLLRESLISIKQKPVIYSLRVDLELGHKVRVVIPIPGDPENSWSFFRYCGMCVGWSFIPMRADSGHEIFFLADFPGHADLPAYFSGHNSVEIKIYENGETIPARSKILTW